VLKRITVIACLLLLACFVRAREQWTSSAINQLDEMWQAES